jgi:hypothetical protein
MTDIKQYSDFVVYVDESGDYSIESINLRYPLFVLAFCIIKKKIYANNISPAVRMLKFDTFGHDMVIFHEHELRKKEGSFSKLGKLQRDALLESLSSVIDESNFTIVPIIIDKSALKRSGLDLPHAYHLAMRFGLEQVYKFLESEGQKDLQTHIRPC